jgi:hypothetical protein
MFFRLGFFINYYGIENFNIKEYKIYENITQKELDEEEIKYIHEHGTINTRNSNELITIKITNHMRNELIKKFIDNNIKIEKLYKLIYTFNYNYNNEKTDFILNDTNTKLLDELLKTTLFNKIINTKVLALNDETTYYILTKEYIEDENILEDFMKYIEFFQ